MQMLLVFFIGLVTSFLSNISGGGGALIQIPALLAIGVSPTTAIGTIKLGSLGLIAGSMVSSKKKAVVRKDYLIPMLIIVTIASIIGPRLVLTFSDETVKLVSSVLIILSAILSLATFKMAKTAREVSKASRYTGYAAYFVVVTILAGIGSGMGLVANYALISLLGMSALETVATRRAAGLIGVPLQFLAFAFSQHVNYKLGIALLLGTIIGSFIGMRVAISKGNGFVAKAMAVVSILLVLSLFL